MEFPDMLDHHDKEIKRLCKNKNALDEIEKNKKTIRLEYQRGFADGGKDMNEKWLITQQGLIGEFLTYLKNRELDFAKDVDTLQFTIEGLEREGFKYIREFNKEYKERKRE